MTCPSIFELTNADLALRQDLATHVRGCARCAGILAAWHAAPLADAGDEAVAFDVTQSAWRPRATPDAPVAVGAIHAIAAPDLDLLLLAVVIDLDDELATLFPLTDEVHMAGDWDVIVDDDLLGYPVVIEAWNTVEVPREQIRERLAVTGDGLQADLLDLYDRSLVGEASPDKIPQGPPLDRDDDPRHAFREQERERVARYAQPFEPMGFGAMVKAARETRGIAVAELAERSELRPAVLQQLEADSVDLLEQVPVSMLARLLRELDVEPSEMLYSGLEDAATANLATQAAAPALARRRQGVRTARGQAPEAERRERARGYVEQIRARLEAR